MAQETRISGLVGGDRGKNTHRNLILAIACVAQFMVVLDVSIVNVALPSIRSSLGFSAANLQWILNAYTLTFAGLLLLGGRTADLFGRKKMFVIGLGLFTFASLLGAIAQSQDMLIFARAVQGIGGAILSPSSLTIITTTFSEGKERAKALGMWSAVAGAGGAAGALLGGVLTDLLSWRWIFLINLPIGIITIVGTVIYLSELRSNRSQRSLDIVGSLLVTFGVTALVFGLVRGGDIGWTTGQSLGGFAAAIVLLAAFLIYESKVAASPIVPLGMFRRKSLSAANASMFFVGGAIFASWYFLSLYMQEILGYSPLKAGLAFVPQTLAIIVGAQISSRIVSRVGPRVIVMIGPVISAVGLFWLHGISLHSAYLTDLFAPSVLITLGMGLSFTPLAIAATSGVPREQAGLASGLLNTSRQLGGAIGLAALSALAISRANSYLHHNIGAAQSHHVVVLASLTAGYAAAMEVSGVIAIAAAIVATLLPGRPGPASSAHIAAPQSAKVEESVIGFEGA